MEGLEGSEGLTPPLSHIKKCYFEGLDGLESLKGLTPPLFQYLKSYFEGLDTLMCLKYMKGLTANFILLKLLYGLEG